MSAVEISRAAPAAVKRILVVDDEEGLREMLSGELTLAGHEVSKAANGEDALALIGRDKFHLVVSDMNMPGMNGLQLIEAIHRLDPDLEIILMTGFATVETAVAAMKMGAYDFIQKPFHLEEMLALVEKSLEKSELKLMRAVYEASCSIFQSVNLDTLLPMIADQSLKILAADAATIMTIDGDGKLVVAATAGLPRAGCGACPVNLSGTHPTLPFWDAPTIVSGDAGLSVPCLKNAGSSIAHPLMANGNRVGMLVVNRISNPKPFARADLRLATIFVAQAAQAIHNANLYRQLHEAQEQLVQSEKLASIGQLAAGVAHEINNPLSAILGFAQLLLEDTGLTESQRQDLETINAESLRCRNIIQDLLQFSRRKSAAMGPVEIGAVLRSTVSLAHNSFLVAGLDVTLVCAPDLPTVWGEAGLIQQVVLNIATNARQAMEPRRSGALAITAERDGNAVVIRFKDNGPGIPPDIQKKIFDPFFTTKPVGKGTGLGLSICYGIVHQHGGSLRVESAPGKGATFVLTLPVAHAAGWAAPSAAVA